ncbi:MAG: hypothetical protein ACREGC_02850, partial [Minisyncoccia bacterium]
MLPPGGGGGGSSWGPSYSSSPSPGIVSFGAGLSGGVLTVVFNLSARGSTDVSGVHVPITSIALTGSITYSTVGALPTLLITNDPAQTLTIQCTLPGTGVVTAQLKITTSLGVFTYNLTASFTSTALTSTPSTIDFPVEIVNTPSTSSIVLSAQSLFADVTVTGLVFDPPIFSSDPANPALPFTVPHLGPDV